MKNIIPRCVFLLSITTVAVLLVACSDSSPRGGEGNGNDIRINVLATDFSFSLDRSETEAGRITFVIENDGSVQHDFTIRGDGVEQKTPMIEPGESATLTVDLEPGTYAYVCTIPGHEQLGMIGSFAVTSN